MPKSKGARGTMKRKTKRQMLQNMEVNASHAMHAQNLGNLNSLFGSLSMSKTIRKSKRASNPVHHYNEAQLRTLYSLAKAKQRASKKRQLYKRNGKFTNKRGHAKTRHSRVSNKNIQYAVRAIEANAIAEELAEQRRREREENERPLVISQRQRDARQLQKLMDSMHF